MSQNGINTIRNNKVFSSNSSRISNSYINKYKSLNSNTKIIYSIIFILVLIFIILSIYLGISYYNYYNVVCHQKKDFWDYIIDFNSSEICIMKTPPPEPPKEVVPLINIIKDDKEVFHIANQDYTYDQAKCKCESYGAILATKEEITKAYNNGANWCTYGWSDKQSAYYPVQKCDWDKIQSENQRLPKNQHKFCGMPGLNGGFFANPTIKFGANCYGIKPKGSVVKEKKPYCPPMNFCKLESNFQASNKLDSDEIVSFNNEKWNMDI
jgi:hypothetical protein